MKNDKQQWHLFLYGAEKHSSSSSSEKNNGHQPNVNIMQRITQDVALRLLFYHIDWIKDDIISREQAAWMWALLTRLDKVMTSDETSILRDVSRRLLVVRQNQTDPDSAQLAYLNILITIIATAFGQADLI